MESGWLSNKTIDNNGVRQKEDFEDVCCTEIARRLLTTNRTKAYVTLRGNVWIYIRNVLLQTRTGVRKQGTFR